MNYPKIGHWKWFCYVVKGADEELSHELPEDWPLKEWASACIWHALSLTWTTRRLATESKLGDCLLFKRLPLTWTTRRLATERWL